ncbi:MAG: carbonic anhydrase, partial [Oceanospirillum sp.]|nr:carbonic anhydrase [Oceanospirillum sp.]
DMNALDGLPHVKEWLGHCRSAMEIVRERHDIAHSECIGHEYLDEAIEQNVLQQVQHIRTHPAVAAKLATGKVDIHGWIYNIKTGGVRCCNHNDTEFQEFEQQYATVIERVQS